MRFQDKFASGIGVVSNPFFNPDSSFGARNGGYPAITLTLNGQSVSGDTDFSVPVLYPFGFMSIPASGTQAVTMNIQGNTNRPVVVGQLPAFSNYYPVSTMIEGESVQYSYYPGSLTGYSMQANLDGLHALLMNAQGNFKATLLYGENIVKVLTDMTTFLDQLSTWLTGFQSAYNQNFTTPTPYPAAITPRTTIDANSADLSAGKGYVNNTGEPM